MKGFSSLLLKVVLPILLLIIVFKQNSLYGFGVILILILIGVFYSRSEIFAFIGNLKYKKGEYDDSIKWLRRAYNTKGCIIKYKNGFGYLLIKLGRIEEAEQILTEISNSKLTKDEGMLVKCNLSLLVWKKGNIYKAISMLQEVYKDFKHSNVYSSLGYLLILKGDLEKALQFNLEAYDYNDCSAVIQDNLGQNYYLLGQYDKAEEIYEKTLASNPSFPEAYFNYSLVLAKKGKLDKALELAQKSLDYQFTAIGTITKEAVILKIDELKRMKYNNKCM